MAKEKVIRNNPNIRTNFNFPSFGFNSPGSLSRIKSRKGIQPELVDQTPEVKSFLSPIMEQQQNLGLMSASTMPAANLITPDKAEETKKQIDNLIAAEGTDLNKHTGLGNMLARLGGAQIATEEERAAATPELRELYNQQRLAARNKGIGQMLFALSDALGGRDVVGRFVDRQAAMQPEEETISEMRAKIARKIAKGEKITSEEYNTLLIIDPEASDLKYTSPELFEDQLYSDTGEQTSDGKKIVIDQYGNKFVENNS